MLVSAFEKAGSSPSIYRLAFSDIVLRQSAQVRLLDMSADYILGQAGPAIKVYF